MEGELAGRAHARFALDRRTCGGRHLFYAQSRTIQRIRDMGKSACRAALVTKHPKRPRDLNQWAKYMVDLATGATQEPVSSPTKNAAAAELGRCGGLVGGKARAAKMTPEQRKKSAKKAAEVLTGPLPRPRSQAVRRVGADARRPSCSPRTRRGGWRRPLPSCRNSQEPKLPNAEKIRAQKSVVSQFEFWPH